MIYEVQRQARKYRIFPSSDSMFIEIGDIGSLDLIDKWWPKKLLLKNGMEFAVYYHQLAPIQENGLDTSLPSWRVPHLLTTRDYNDC